LTGGGSELISDLKSRFSQSEGHPDGDHREGKREELGKP